MLIAEEGRATEDAVALIARHSPLVTRQSDSPRRSARARSFLSRMRYRAQSSPCFAPSSTLDRLARVLVGRAVRRSRACQFDWSHQEMLETALHNMGHVVPASALRPCCLARATYECESNRRIRKSL